jgi:hypothetical protein
LIKFHLCLHMVSFLGILRFLFFAIHKFFLNQHCIVGIICAFGSTSAFKVLCFTCLQKMNLNISLCSNWCVNAKESWPLHHYTPFCHHLDLFLDLLIYLQMRLHHFANLLVKLKCETIIAPSCLWVCACTCL